MRDNLQGPGARKQLEEAQKKLVLSFSYILSSFPSRPSCAPEGAPGEGPGCSARGHTWSGDTLWGLAGGLIGVDSGSLRR